MWKLFPKPEPQEQGNCEKASIGDSGSPTEGHLIGPTGSEPGSAAWKLLLVSSVSSVSLESFLTIDILDLGKILAAFAGKHCFSFCIGSDILRQASELQKHTCGKGQGKDQLDLGRSLINSDPWIRNPFA